MGPRPQPIRTPSLASGHRHCTFRGHENGPQDQIREVLASVPGELHEAPFVDFSTTRNLALELAGTRSEFILFLDAEEAFVALLRLAGLSQEIGHAWPEVQQRYLVKRAVYAWKAADLLADSTRHMGALDVGEQAARQVCAARPDEAGPRERLVNYERRLVAPEKPTQPSGLV